MKKLIILLMLLMVTSVTMGTTFTVVTPGASDTTVVRDQTYPGATSVTLTEVTPGASDTTSILDLTYPRTVVPAGSIASPSLATDSVFNVHLGETISVTNGGTGSTSTAGALTALGGASLNGSSTVDFASKVSTRTPSSVFIVTESTITLASNATMALSLALPGVSPEYQSGVLEIFNVTNINSALFSLRGGQSAVDVLLNNRSTFSNTKDAALTVNVYFEGTQIVIQNSTAAPCTLLLSYRGTRL